MPPTCHILPPPPYVTINKRFQVRLLAPADVTSIRLDWATKHDEEALNTITMVEDPEDACLRAFRRMKKKSSSMEKTTSKNATREPPKFVIDSVEPPDKTDDHVHVWIVPKCIGDVVVVVKMQDVAGGTQERSAPFTCCGNALIRDDSAGWPDIFFCVTGGSSNQLTLRIFLADLQPALAEATLGFQLYTENGLPAPETRKIKGNVGDEPVLAISQPVTKFQQGAATISFRIQDVSRNHGSRRFVLVTYVASPIGEEEEVAPVASLPVKVMSKITSTATLPTSSSSSIIPMASSSSEDGISRVKRAKRPSFASDGVSPRVQVSPTKPSTTTTTSSPSGGGGGAPLPFPPLHANIGTGVSNAEDWCKNMAITLDAMRRNDEERAALRLRLVTLTNHETITKMLGEDIRAAAPISLSSLHHIFSPGIIVPPPAGSFNDNHALPGGVAAAPPPPLPILSHQMLSLNNFEYDAPFSLSLTSLPDTKM